MVISLADPQSTVRKAAAAALRQIDEEWERSAAAQSAVPALEAAAQAKDYWVRHSANYVLQCIRNAHLAAPPPSAASDTEHYKRLGAVEMLTAALRDSDRDFRQAAAEALGRIGNAGCIPSLVAALSDEDPWVRTAAGSALQALGWQPSPEQAPLQMISGRQTPARKVPRRE